MSSSSADDESATFRRAAPDAERDAARATSPLLKRSEAAAFLRQSLSSFERHVQPELEASGRVIRIGHRLFVSREDLESWLAEQRHFASVPVTASLTSTRPSRASASANHSALPCLSDRAAKRLASLTKQVRSGTPRSSKDE